MAYVSFMRLYACQVTLASELKASDTYLKASDTYFKASDTRCTA